MKTSSVSAGEAEKRLIDGNRRFTGGYAHSFEFPPEKLAKFSQSGQSPYAVVVTCSDSRVIPECIFSADMGDLFVIRVAGNVIGNEQLGSIEYAISHLGTKLVAVLGHTHCGAVEAALSGLQEGFTKYITGQIADAIGDEKDEYRACCLNVENSCSLIEKNLNIPADGDGTNIKVIGAVYDLESGKVEFLKQK